MARDRLKKRKLTDNFSDEASINKRVQDVIDREIAKSGGDPLIWAEQEAVKNLGMPGVQLPEMRDIIGQQQGSNFELNSSQGGSEGLSDLSADALNVDRLRAFQERRQGKTPSNQFSKLLAAENKANSRGGRGLQKVVFEDMSQGTFNSSTGIYRDSLGNITTKRAYRETPEIAGKKTEAKEATKIRMGLTERVTDKNFRTLLASTKMETKQLLGKHIDLLNAAKENLRSLKRNSGDLSQKNVMAQVVAVRQLVKIADPRPTDEDVKQISGLQSIMARWKEDIANMDNPEVRKRLLKEASDLYAQMIIIKEDLIDEKIVGQAESISDGDQSRYKSALSRLSGLRDKGPIDSNTATIINKKRRIRELRNKLDQGNE